MPDRHVNLRRPDTPQYARRKSEKDAGMTILLRRPMPPMRLVPPMVPPVKRGSKRGSYACDKSSDAKRFKSRAKTMGKNLFVPILSSSHCVRATLLRVSRDARLLAHTYPSAISSVGLFSILGPVLFDAHDQTPRRFRVSPALRPASNTCDQSQNASQGQCH